MSTEQVLSLHIQWRFLYHSSLFNSIYLCSCVSCFKFHFIYLELYANFMLVNLLQNNLSFAFNFFLKTYSLHSYIKLKHD